jgi:hypothetical protein
MVNTLHRLWIPPSILIGFCLAALSSLCFEEESKSLGARTQDHPAGRQFRLPTKVGQTFVIDDFDNKVLSRDLGSNYFAGNCGVTESNNGIASSALSKDSHGTPGGSLRFMFDFKKQPAEGPFAGLFFSLLGLTDTLISLDGSGKEPAKSTRFPGYSLNTRSLFGSFRPWAGRKADQLRFDVRLLSKAAVTLRLELKDEKDRVIYTRRPVRDTEWRTIALALPDDFEQGDRRFFDWGKVRLFTIIVERRHVADGVSNPTQGDFLLDNLALVDRRGLYPDLDKAQDLRCAPSAGPVT